MCKAPVFSNGGYKQGKRILFLECLLDKGFSYYLVLLLNPVSLAGQGLQDLDAFALQPHFHICRMLLPFQEFPTATESP